LRLREITESLYRVIFLPCISEEEKIAKFLMEIDQKIEDIAQQMNSTE